LNNGTFLIADESTKIG